MYTSVILTSLKFKLSEIANSSQLFIRCWSKISHESAKVCCASGKPELDDYKPRGVELNLGQDLKVYQVGKENEKGVVLVYDIFGFQINQTRRFADYLAKDNFNIIMPDLFRGKPWSIENFPPKDPNELMSWIEKLGPWYKIQKDLKLSLKQLHKTGAQGVPGIVGFCWGGKIASLACHGSDFSCGVSVHGAMITPDITKDISKPMMFLPAGDDPCLDVVKQGFDGKPFGHECVFYRFEEMRHGFAAARADWKDEKNKNEILKVLSMAADFFNKHIR